MPALEMAQETGKLVAWLKKEGEQVRKGEMLLEIETDKAVVEIEAAGDGVLAGISARPGDVVPVGHTIGWLLQPGETAPAAQESARLAPRISPKARRLALERGVDLGSVKGSGPGGEILAGDIEAGRPSSVGRLMAERTTQSWTTVPHFFLTKDIDATALNAVRARVMPAIEQSHGVTITHTDLLLSLVGRALRAHPRMNGSKADVNVAIGIAVENAVVTGVVRHADTAALGDIAVRRRELTDRARAGRLQPADIADATFTISNLGMFGVDAFTAIIVPPQAGILAVGAIAERAVAVVGQLAVRPMMTLTLSCDHRVIDGAAGATFLAGIAEGIASADRHF